MDNVIKFNNEKGELVKFFLFQTTEEEFMYKPYEEIENIFDSEAYELVYSEVRMMGSINPEDEFLRFNGDNPRPENYYGTSISISDVLMYIYNNKVYTFYCDTAGFEPIHHFATDHIFMAVLNDYDIKKEYYDLLNSNEDKERKEYLKENYLLPISLAAVRKLINHNQDLMIFIKNNSDTELIQYDNNERCYLTADFIHKFEYDYDQADKCLFDIASMQKCLLDMFAEINVRLLTPKEKKKYFKKYSENYFAKRDITYRQLYFIEKVKELIREEQENK